MKKCPKRLLIFLMVLSFGTSILAAPSYLFRRHTASGGLSSNTVRTMIQSRSGLIWIGTSDGLDSFDGLSYRHFDLSGDAVSNYVNCLYQDSHGELWAGTDNSVYHGPESGPFVKLDLPGMPSGVLTRIVEDPVGNLWFSTRSEGIFRYDGNQVTPFTVGNNPYVIVYSDSYGTVWAATAEGPDYLYTFNRGEGAFRPAYLRYEGCVPARVSAMTRDASGNLWMGTWDHGLYRLGFETRTVTAYGGGEGFHYLHSLKEIDTGTFLIGSDDGLLWFNALTGEKQLYVNDLTDPSSLSNKFVYPVVLDNEGGIWVGTYYGGVNYASPVAGRFRSQSLSILAGATESYTVSCFCEGNDGTVWIGSDNGGLVHYDPVREHRLGVWQGLNVQALLSEGEQIWVGTYLDGLQVFDRRGFRRRYDLDDSSVYSVFRSSDGTLWAGTTRTLEQLNPGSDRFDVRYVTGTTTLSIAETPDGSLWFATIDKGLVRRFPEGSWGRYTDSDGLVSDRLNYLTVTPEGKLYICTKRGINTWTAEEGFRWMPLEGEPDVLFVVPTGEHLWLTTDKGVTRYTPGTGVVATFGPNDGIATDHFMEGSGMVTSDGRIWLGATDGFETFFPARIRRNTYVPPVVLAVESTGDRSRVFHFAALSYCAPEQNHYSYKLEGFDNDWLEMTGGGSVTYGYIPPGRYRFRVKGSNNDTLWNETGAEAGIYIRPHPLLSNLALTLYVLLFATGLFFLVRWMLGRREQQYSRRYSEMLREQEKRDLDARVKFVTTVAHEIRTPLSLITAPVERICSREIAASEEIRSDIHVIERNSRRLIKLVNQILDFSRITGESLTTANTRWGCISDVVKGVYDSFVPTLEERKIEASFDCPEPLEGDCDEDMLDKMVSNLLSNALKYTRSRVEVSVRADGPFYLVSFADDGPGIRRDAQKRIFQPFFRLDETREGTGLGLPIVKKMAESLGGSILVDSTPGEGSTFTLRLPLTDRMKGIEVLAEPVADENPDLPLPEASDHRGLKPVLLIVEDDDEMRSFLSDAFKDRYDVLVAGNGERAKALLRLSGVSLVISDWMMPGVSGAELCQWMRAQNDFCHIPFIMLTARTDDESMIRSASSGADAHVKKPFSLQHLQALADHLVEMRGILARKYSGQLSVGPVTREDADGFVARLGRVIESNIANTDLSVEMLATEMCVSRSGLFAKVKEVTGLTPNNLIVNARLQAAANLLEEGRHSVNEVCYMVGFNAPSYFSKSFFRRYGVTPHQWMEKRRQ